MRIDGKHGSFLFRLAPACLAWGALVAFPVWANPVGPQVVNGNVSFQNPDAATLNITNSPGAIIRWQDFSIAPGEVTNFIQQSASSAVLNRVVGGNISQIFGNLISNGQVYLINPSGILIGKGAIVDTAGFVASTLNMRKDDFLAGNLSFSGRKGAGDVVNEGLIRTTPGGMVLLLAPDITNSGVIETPEGEILLAAGRKITITSLDAEGVQFEIQSPSHSVTNIGKLVADGGAVGVFAGTLNNSGVIQANALTRDEAGRIVLSAKDKLEVSSTGSVTADGPNGGDITLESGKQTLVEGELSATGNEGAGGNIRILGEQVTLAGNAEVDVSGASGGGSILVGGDFQGANPAITNAKTTYVGPSVVLSADALDAGDGGRIIVWADQLTRYFGNLSARGGPNGGNGGFAEISGKQQLVMDGGANLGAPLGQLGTLLLDPLDLFVDDRGGQLAGLTNQLTDVPLNVVTVSPDTLEAVVGNVDLRATRDLYFLSDVNLTAAGQGLTAQAGDDIFIDADITTNGGALALTAGNGFDYFSFTESSPMLATAGGAITLTATAGQLNLPNVSLDAGSGAVNVTAPTGIYTSNVTGGVVNLTSTAGTVDTGNINSSGNLSLNGTSVQTVAINTNGGALNATASNGHFIASDTIDTRLGQTGLTGGAVTIAADDSYGNYGYGYVDTRAINAGNANVSLSGESIDTSGQSIDTTGNVTLTAVHNDAYADASITTKVNNAAAVTALANHQETATAYSATIDIDSDTTLNATNVTATTSGCYYYGDCGGANITLSGTNGVNVGTVTASAPTNFNNYIYGPTYADPRYENINEWVNISSSTGSILAMSSTSQVTAADVTLSTIPDSVPTGGDIGSSATPLRVDAERNLVFNAGGDFDVDLVGAGPSRLDIQLGVAPSVEEPWFGILSGGTTNGVTLVASGDDTTVTVGSFTLTGFDQRVFNQNPSISLTTPNGNMDVATVSVPKGDNTGSYSPATRYTSGFYFPADTCVNGTASCTYRNSPSGLTTSTVTPNYELLPVTLRASGDLDVISYTRAGVPSDKAKSTVFQSDDASVTLATINGNKDAISIVADTGVALTDDVTTGGNVSITNSVSGVIAIGDGAGDVLDSDGTVTVSNSGSGTGDVAIVSIDTTGGSGGVSITANGAAAAVGAALDNAGLEINSAGNVSITANTIGSSGFAKPLDITGPAVTLSRPSGSANAGSFGFTGAPVIANTQVLTINAASTSGFTPVGGSTFNISTGSSALNTLNVTADPVFVGSGGLAQVRTEAGSEDDKTYIFASDGANFSFNPGGIPATQFVDGQLSFTAASGNIDLPADLNLGSIATLALTAQRGSISTQDLDAAAVTLRAQPSYLGVFTATPVSITTGKIGSANRPDTLTIQSGNYYRPGYVQTGIIEADTVTIDSYGLPPVELRSINVGNIGAVTRAGSVALTANDNWQGGSGDIQAGNIRASSVDLLAGQYYATGAINTGNLDATSGITAYSDLSIATGTLDAETINLGAAYCCYPSISTGAIGGTTAPNSVNITGSSVDIDGAVIGDPSAEDTITLTAVSGLLTVDGDITGGDGSTITLNSGGSTPFLFSQINAGATGTVSITSANGIEQNSGTGGITAKNMTLRAASGQIQLADVVDGDGYLDLFGAKNLTIVAGDSVDLDANESSTLEFLSITLNDCPDCMGFDLVNLGGDQSLAVTGTGSTFDLELNSSSPLDFIFTANDAGIQSIGSGIVTSGGDVTLNSADVFDGSTGGITTSGGSVTMTADTTVTTGAINSGGGAIDVTAGTGIDVSGAVTTGSSGGPVSMRTTTNNIDGIGTITSDTSVSLTANAGNVGSDPSNDGNAIDIDAPTVTLVAKGTDNAGSVYAVLVGTNNLTLSAEEYFGVGSDTAFSNLSVTTGMGTGVNGAPVLTAPGQTFNWTRIFGDGELVVTSITGTGASTLTLNTLDGDLRVTGPIAATSLTLGAGYNHTGGIADFSGDSDLVLDGRAGALALANTTQVFRSGGSIEVLDNVTATATTQSLTARENINLLAGASAGESILFTASTQTLTAGEFSGLASDINLTADVGSVSLQGVSQTLFAYGDINLSGGTASSAGVTVNATGNQLFSAGNHAGSGNGNILMQAGTGSAANILVRHSGSGSQTLRADGNITMTAGASANTSTILVDNQAGAQDLDAEGAIVLKGGAGTAATARIVNSGSGNQLIGNTFGYNHDGRLYTAGSITVEGGSGSGAFAAVESTATGGSLQVFETEGLLKFQGGTGDNATATATTSGAQQLGWSYFPNVGNMLGGFSLLGGSGTGAFASVTTPVAQQLWSYGDITLQGGAQDAYAALMANSQGIYYGDVALTGGTGSNAYALIQATTSQNFSSGDLVLTGGVGADAYAKVQAGTTQTFNINDMTLAGGVADIEFGPATGSFARVLALGGSQNFSMNDLQATGGDAIGTDATVQATTSQTFFADNVTLTGGSGTNAFVRVLAGSSQFFSMDNLGVTGGSAAGTDATVQAVTSQNFNGDDITLTGGSDASAVALFKGVGQTFDADDIMVESKTAAARIQDTSTGVQDFDVDSVFVKGNGTAVAEITTGGSQVFDVGGGFTIETFGSGNAQVVSASTQEVTADYLKVASNINATGNAALSAPGDQTIRTTNGLAAVDGASMRVAALGTGTASVTSGGNQVIELDYPDMMYTNRDGTLKLGDPEAQSVSTVSAAGDQTIIAREIFIEGGGPTEVGTGAAASSKLNADGAQVISTLLGGITIAGGGGDGASASIDPSSQSIVTNGPLLLTGGSGSNATSSIFSSGSLFIAATFGDIVLTGGTGSGASASITTSFSSMSILTPGLVDFIAGSGSDADAFMSAANGFGLVNIFCGAGCSYQTLFGNPVGNGNSDAGVVGVPGNTFDITEVLGSGYWFDWYFADNSLDQEDEPGLALICR